MNDIVSVEPDFIKNLDKSFNEVSFKRIEKINGLYITNDISKSLINDRRIFIETQVKRFFRISPGVHEVVKKNLDYFSQQEDKLNNVYQFDQSQNLLHENYALHFIGHATVLIQLPDCNILTDPVFGDLSRIFYPAKTSSYPILDELPQVNIILLTHNHRDHLDKSTMLKILHLYLKKNWPQPLVLVPLGDGKFLKNLGFKCVEEADWFSRITVKNNGFQINFISIPSDHRSGRNWVDHHKSLVTGWVINPEKSNVIFKLSGDTRPLSDENQKAVDAVLWNEIRVKMDLFSGVFTDIVCFEPDGPNYTRVDMDITHQSTSYSVLLKFKHAANLSKFSKIRLENILPKIQTVMIHRNKFELGPDRFNEGLFVFKKLFLYLSLSIEDLKVELDRQILKIRAACDWGALQYNTHTMLRPILLLLGNETTLVFHSKYFIIQDLNSTMEVLEELNIENHLQLMKDVIVTNTVFPKIGERLNNRQLKESCCNPCSIKKYNGFGSKYKHVE